MNKKPSSSGLLADSSKSIKNSRRTSKAARFLPFLPPLAGFLWKQPLAPWEKMMTHNEQEGGWLAKC